MLCFMSTVTEITQAIERLDVSAQVQLLQELATHLKIKPEDVAWLNASEQSFDFWDNPEDAVYDRI
jgi:hypothetical protein